MPTTGDVAESEHASGHGGSLALLPGVLVVRCQLEDVLPEIPGGCRMSRTSWGCPGLVASSGPRLTLYD